MPAIRSDAAGLNLTSQAVAQLTSSPNLPSGWLDESSQLLVPFVGLYGSKSNIVVGPMGINIQSLGADMSGGTIADNIMTAALAQLPNSGGRLYIPTGTLSIATMIPGASSLRLVGDGPTASIVKWNGAANAQMISTNPASGSNILGLGVEHVGLDANNISGVTPLLLNSWQGGLIDDVLLQNVAGASTPALRMEVNSGNSSANNTYGNVIRHLRIKNTPVGIQLGGQLGGSTNNFVTNNRFFGVYLESVTGTGIRGIQWCDSNAFLGVEIQLAANNAIGVLLNDSATPGSDVGVYNFNFHHISIDSFNITGATGFLLNTMKQCIAYDFYHSPVVFNGTLINDNLGRALSYDFVLTQDNNSTNNIVHWSKNLIMDNGAGAGLGAYANWLAFTAVTAGNAPTLASVGSDANPNLQLSAKGSGFVYVASPLRAGKDFRRSTQTPTETVLVSGVDATAGEIINVTLTAARLVGAPLNATAGQRLTFTLIQDGTGGRAVTWNVVFKVSWSDTGNTLGKRSTISFVYDGANWNQDGAQTPYV